MDALKYPHLFTPITIGNTLFRNRLFASPTGPANLTSHNYPSRETSAYYERKALGGAAYVCVGNCSVDAKNGRSVSSLLRLDDPNTLEPLVKLSGAISRHGAVASIELQHGGDHSYGSSSEGNPIYGPVEYIDADGRHILPMTDEIIENTIKQFADAALWAKRCGFGMVTIHGGHGWLISQFVSPISNTRTDRWGGSVENRCRLPVAISDAIRRAVGPGFPVEIRISGSECHSGGYDIDEGVAIAKQLDGHVDLINVSAGSHEVKEVFTVTQPSMFLIDGVNVKYAEAIKKNVKNTYVSAVGALADPELMEDIIASGKADIVAVGRGLLADPDLPLKARMNRGGDINTCMRCLACFSNRISTRQYLCAINPLIGREAESKFTQLPAKRKRVLIAGGGIAGMQAAITAAERGHDVILCEKSDRLGGVLRCEDKVPFKKSLGRYLDRQEKAVIASGCKIMLGTAATPELAEELNPDVIIAAMGARPIKPGVNGIDAGNVYGAEAVYINPELAGKRIVILGGGLVGTELGIHLAMEGRDVTILEMMPQLSFGVNHLHGTAVTVELRRLGVKVNCNTTVLEITAGGVIGESGGTRQLYEADTVIYAIGQKPLREDAGALRFSAPEFHQIGDCLVPRNITEATKSAFNTALDIGIANI